MPPEGLKIMERAICVAEAATLARRLQNAPDEQNQTWRRHLEVKGLPDYEGIYTRQAAAFGFPCWTRVPQSQNSYASPGFQHLVYHVQDNRWCLLETDFADFASCADDTTKAFGLMKDCGASSKDGLLGTRQWQVRTGDAVAEAQISILVHDHADSSSDKYTEPADMAELQDFTKALEDAASGLRQLNPQFRHPLADLLRESDKPPVTVSLGADDEPALWECEVEGSWTKLDRATRVHLEQKLSEALKDETTVTAKYHGDFGDGNAEHQVQLQGDQPERCLSIAKQVNLNSQKSYKLRRTMFGNGATVSVEQWYQAILMDDKLCGATGRTICDENPQHVAFCLDALQNDKNFESAMKGVLTKMHKSLDKHSKDEHDRYFKDADWESMIADVVARAQAIPLNKSVDPVASKKLKGLGTVNDLVTSMLSPAQETLGVCIASMYEFFTALIEPQTKVNAAIKTVDAAASLLKEAVEKAAVLDEIEMQLALHDEAAECASLLRDGLPKFDITIEPEPDDSSTEMLEAATNQFNDKLVELHDQVNTDLLNLRKALMSDLTDAMVAVRERTQKMVALQGDVEQRAREADRQTEEFTQRMTEKQEQARCTVTASQDRIATLNRNIEKEMSRRSEEREKHQSTVKDLVTANQDKQAQVEKLLAEIKANEEELRGAAQADRDAETTHQHTIAAYEQNLGTLAGSLDEMQDFVDVLEESVDIARKARELTGELLVGHEGSVKQNIERDVAQTEALGRKLLTTHYDEYCKAFTKTSGDKQMLLSGVDEIELEIDNIQAGVAKAVKFGRKDRIAQLKDERAGLKEQLKKQRRKVEMLDKELEGFFDSVDPVLFALGTEGEPGCDFMLTTGRDDELLQVVYSQVDEGDGPPKDPRSALEYDVLDKAAQAILAANQDEIDQLMANLKAKQAKQVERMPAMIAYQTPPEPEPEPSINIGQINVTVRDGGGPDTEQGNDRLARTYSAKRSAAIAAQARAGGNLPEGTPPKKKGWTSSLFGGDK